MKTLICIHAAALALSLNFHSDTVFAAASGETVAPDKALTKPVDAAKEKIAEHVKPGEVFTDCKDCPAMVVIPAGKFEMGTPEAVEERFKEEGPVHRVSLKSFAVGRTHVTRGQFAAFISATGYKTSTSCWVVNSADWRVMGDRDWRNPGYAQDDKHPVVCVSWNDARAYAKWLSEKTGASYRLPTEAEWEYAARATTKTARFWGDNPHEACSYANVADAIARKQQPEFRSWTTSECSDGWGYTSPVASFKPNAFGLYDMLGNAWQWVEDCWNDNYKGAPDDGSAWTAGRCEHRVIRGGSALDATLAVRSAMRLLRSTDDRFFTIGFRVARALP